MTFLDKTLKASTTACMLAFSSAAIIGIDGLSTHSAVQAQTISASQFIENAWNDYSRTGRTSEFVDHVDFYNFSQQTLGPDWRSASEEQRERFQNAYRSFLINEYGHHLQGYAGGTISTTQSTSRNGHMVVRAEISKPGKNTLELDFYLYQTRNGWRIYNLKVEGFLLSSHFRSEFGRIMDRGNGIESLIRHLERSASLQPDIHTPNRNNSDSEFTIVRGVNATDSRPEAGLTL